MKIAIFYIGTGRYSIFWEEFFKSSEKNFIPGADKHYYFFTDDEKMKSSENVTIVPQDNLGWPLITCLRYKMFNKFNEELKKYDYAFFFNGNMEVVKPVTAEEFLPNETQELVICKHPVNTHVESTDDLPFERNPISTSCITKQEGLIYYQACLFGATSENFRTLLTVCEKMMDDDLKNNFIPVFHDESVFNKYVLGKDCKVLGQAYIQPVYGKPWMKYHPETKIIQRDKAKLKYGGHAYLRGETDKKMTLLDLIKQKLSKLR